MVITCADHCDEHSGGYNNNSADFAGIDPWAQLVLGSKCIRVITLHKMSAMPVTIMMRLPAIHLQINQVQIGLHCDGKV
jgi:hypothetical protein